MKSLILILSLLIGTQSWAQQTKPCVNVFFDRSTDKTYWMGKTYATLLQNLLGHFPKYQQIVSPIEMYEAGDIEKCHATFYIGSYFNNQIPAAFLKEYATTKKRVAWMGYSIWQLGDGFEKIFGYSYSHLTTLDREHLDQTDRPSFFKNILYKGEVFFKYGDWSKDNNQIFLAPFEQVVLKERTPGKSQVLAWAEQNVTKEVIPYVVQAQNHFFVADVPFSFLHEADRYFVFADILFDILGEKPRHQDKLALIRIEDVHAIIPIAQLYKTTDVLKKHNVPAHISLIPIMFDPLRRGDSVDWEEITTMDRKPAFMTWVNDMKKDKAVFIWHGVTHQHKRMKNPHDGLSGNDFEFFDAVNNRPLAEDSPEFVLDKLEEGFYTLQKAGVTPRLWLTPHYQASPLDYIIFGKVFSWNVGRVIYYNTSNRGLVANVSDKDLWFENRNSLAPSLRQSYFRNLEVMYESERWSGQMFPYEIYGDVYGQRLIPENLGNLQPFVNAHVINPRSKEEIVRDAKRNLVLRDTWASLFYHPFLLTSFEEGGRGAYPGDPAELEFIIREIKKLGYKFISLEDFINKNTVEKRPEPLYKENQQ
ncbi:DUF2334 domain-containing protein [Bdellovibrio sp. HCB2-146]|uniref:DUF2334 domain-containing protein n=1 Tax=Bdellovibrio sp. HCB2-146 TaxID=3394362 RepID=UPI0039BC7431